jgi:hypothetical protein
MLPVTEGAHRAEDNDNANDNGEGHRNSVSNSFLAEELHRKRVEAKKVELRKKYAEEHGIILKEEASAKTAAHRARVEAKKEALREKYQKEHGMTFDKDGNHTEEGMDCRNSTYLGFCTN